MTLVIGLTATPAEMIFKRHAQRDRRRRNRLMRRRDDRRDLEPTAALPLRLGGVKRDALSTSSSKRAWTRVPLLTAIDPVPAPIASTFAVLDAGGIAGYRAGN